MREVFAKSMYFMRDCNVLIRYSLLSSVKVWWYCSEIPEDTNEIIFDMLMLLVTLPLMISVSYLGFLVTDKILNPDNRQVKLYAKKKLRVIQTVPMKIINGFKYSHPRDHKNVRIDLFVLVHLRTTTVSIETQIILLLSRRGCETISVITRKIVNSYKLMF